MPEQSETTLLAVVLVLICSPAYADAKCTIANADRTVCSQWVETSDGMTFDNMIFEPRLPDLASGTYCEYSPTDFRKVTPKADCGKAAIKITVERKP